MAGFFSSRTCEFSNFINAWAHSEFLPYLNLALIISRIFVLDIRNVCPGCTTPKNPVIHSFEELTTLEPLLFKVLKMLMTGQVHIGHRCLSQLWAHSLIWVLEEHMVSHAPCFTASDIDSLEHTGETSSVKLICHLCATIGTSSTKVIP